MEITINDTELGSLEIKDKADLDRLNETIRLQQERMKNSLLTKKAPEKVIPKHDENHKHVVATF